MLGCGFVKILIKIFNDNFNIKLLYIKNLFIFSESLLFLKHIEVKFLSMKKRPMKKRFVHNYIHKLLVP